MSTNCGFLKLPTELRLRIYEYHFDPTYWRAIPQDSSSTYFSGERLSTLCALLVFGDVVTSTATVTPPSYERLRRAWEPEPSQFPAFLRICKTVYNEAIDLLYEHTRFTLSIWKETNAGASAHTVATSGCVKRFGLMSQCKFLQRMRNVEIRCHIDVDKHFDRDLQRLEDVVACLRAPRETTTVMLHLWHDRTRIEPNYAWYVRLGRLKDVSKKCQVILQQPLQWTKAESKRLGELLGVLGPETQTAPWCWQLAPCDIDEMELSDQEG